MKTSNKKLFKFLTTLILISFFLAGCSKPKEINNKESKDPLSKTNFFMGTVVSVTLYDHKDEAIIQKAFDRVKEIEDEVSINKSGTELDKVNELSGKEPVKVKNDTFTIVKKGLEYSKLSEGSFDITIGPLVKLWSIGLPEAKVPTKDEIVKTIPLIGYNNLQINEQDKSIFLKQKGMIIDLGGIAKGYTADEISKVLKDNGIKDAIIDLGGNIFAMGQNPNGNPWRIGIQNPFETRGDLVGSINVINKSVVTSGIYERYIEKDGKRYHHILSPFTGYPYDNEIAGITIVSDKSVDGDALSTTVFSKGLEQGMKFVEKLQGIDAIFVTKDKKVYITSGLKDNFKITNTEFTLSN